MKDNLTTSAKWHLDKLNANDWVGESVTPILEAYIAEHPADDDKPITRKWLRDEFGFSECGELLETEDVKLWGSASTWYVYDLEGVTLKTRRHVRMLMKLFGGDE